MTTQIADYAVLAMQSYDFLDEDQPNVSQEDLAKNFGLEQFNGWTQLNNKDASALGKAADGFGAELFFDGNNYVVSLRGTDNWLDLKGILQGFPNADVDDNAAFLFGQISGQLSLAIAYVEELIATDESISIDKITFAGHSLGGGLASALAALYDRPAFVFDPAPIDLKTGILEALPDHPAGSIVADYNDNLDIAATRAGEFFGRIVSAVTELTNNMTSNSVLTAMAVVDWSTVAPSSPLIRIGLPPVMDVLGFSIDQWEDFTRQLEDYLTAFNGMYATLRQTAENQISGYAIDTEVLTDLALSWDATSIPLNGSLNAVDIGETELSSTDLHSQPLLALTQVRNEDGKNIVEQLFRELPGLVDNLFNGELTGFENHKEEKDYTIFIRMLMDTRGENDQFYDDYFTEHKRIADADFSIDRNPVSEYFVQSGLIELGEMVRQDGGNDYLKGDLGAPGTFFGSSQDFIYQQTFDLTVGGNNSDHSNLEAEIWADFLSSPFQFFEITYGSQLFFDAGTPSDELTYGFNFYNDFRVVAVAASGAAPSTIDLQATQDDDQTSLTTLAENEDPSQKANQGWFLFGSLNGADTVTGSDKSDLILTQGGEDVIEAGDGDDVVLGGDGKDELNGEEGSDVLVGGEGDDTFIGSVGSDIIFGGDVGSLSQGGVDSVDFSGLNTSFSVSFMLENAGTLSSVSVSGSDVNSRLYSIDELLLGQLDDTVTIDDLDVVAQDYAMIIDGGEEQSADSVDFSGLSEGVELGANGAGSVMLSGSNLTFTNFEIFDLTAHNDIIKIASAADDTSRQSRLQINTGAGHDIVMVANTVDATASQTLGEEAKEVIVDTGAGDDLVIATGAATIHLGDGADAVYSAGAGSVIYTGPGGIDDGDAINMANTRGSLVADADGYDQVFAYGFKSIGNTYMRHVDAESDFFYGMGGLLKLGLNSNGELVVGDILSDNNNQESFLYIANFNNDPLANPLDLTAGVRLGEIETEMWRTIEGRDSGIGSVSGASLWDFLVAVVKDIFFRANAGGVDPLVFDLDGDGLELSAMVTGVSPMFDMDGDGFAEHTGWVAPDDGLLAIDLNGNGLIDDINELFGGPGLSGFDALAAFDLNADGVIDANDAVFGNLRMWRDLDRDAITDEGELFTLADLDIASIDLSPEDDGSQNALNVVARTGTFTRGDGSVGAVGDVEFRVNNYDTVYIGDTTINAGVAATMPELKGHGTLADLQVSVTLDGVDGPLAQTISSVLPTLNVVDLDVLSERAFAILNAWADAVPTNQVFGDNPDVPVLIDRSGGGLEVVDFALQVTEDVTLEDDTVVSVTYWKRAGGGTPIKDSDGNVIEYPSFEQILAHDTNDGDVAWEVVTSEELGFIERYFGEDIPIEREEALSGSGISGLGDLLGRTELLVEQLALRLAMQGGLSDYFDGVGYSVETDRFAPTTEFELIPFFKKIFEDAPADAAGAQAWLDAWKPLIDTLLSDYDRPGSGRITEPFLFTNVVAAYESVGLPISLADAANSLGVSPDLVDYGTGERTGTSGNEIFYMSSGDDVIESKSGGDVFVFGENFGHDVINDYEQSVDGFDTIRFAHLTPDDVVATREGNDLVITVVETGDTIRVTGQFHDIGYTLSGGMVGPYQGIEEIVFANGDVWGQGEIATAVAHPEDTDDTIVGTDHGDVLDGGAGDDLLQGGNGFDIYRFDAGYGQDTIQDLQMNVLSPAEDLVLFGEGLKREDLSFYRDGDSDDLVINTSGGDSLTIKGQFNGGSALGMEIWIGRIEYFQFTNGDPESQGFDHADIMRTLVSQGKTDDDDVIYGFTFDDVLDGGAGDDFLSGGDKNDTYVFGFGYGSDVFDEGNLDLNFETIDKVLLGAGITQDDLTLERDGGSSDLVVKLTDGSQFTIKKQFLGDNIAGNHYFAIETIEFADGSFWDQEYIYNTLLEHTVGDDELYGFWRDDVMDGGAGDDYLNGGDGDDTYLFGLGYGQDVIHDGFVSVFSNENDRLLFGEGIAKDDVVWSRDGASNDLIVTLADGSTATLQGQFSYNNFGHRYFDIELFEFADGQTMTIWDIQNLLLQATDGDDVLYGFASDDEFDGGAGNDVYYGGEYSDTYHFGYGYGHDRILDEQVSLFIDNNDRIVFGDSVTASEVTVSWTDDRYMDLKLSLGDNDSITIEQYRAGSSQFYVVEEFHFQDGTVWQTADLFNKYLQDTVSSGDDIIAGFAIDDLIDGGDGSDTIYGQNGNDILIGGLGDDTLDGGEGADTYRYALGDGHDWIIESHGNGTSDTLEFAAGITASDISLSRSQEDVEDILLTFSDGGTILLEQQFSIVASSGIEYFQFADGTVWTSESLAGQLADNAWTDGDDTIQGFSGQDDFLYAGGGNDTVYGYSGTDTIIGGLGNDTLDGGSSSDIYHYNLGDGADTIIENYSNGSADKLILGEGILASEVSATRGASDLDEATLSFSDGGSILLKYQFRSITQSGVELIEFADGTVWNHAALQASYFASFNLEESNTIYGFGDAVGDVIDAGAENDTVYGYGGADTIRGGLGNDDLDGGKSSDTYLYDLGDGNDTIIENYSNGSADKLILGSGILANEVIVTRGASDLDEATLSFSDGGSILLKYQFRSTTQSGVELIEFADGTVWNNAALQASYFASFNLEENNTIYGFGDVAGDVIDAGAGNDTVYGYGGADTIQGGLGDDYLEGGKSSDTYVYNLGDGNDTVFENYSSGSADKLLLGDGILVDEVQVVRSTQDSNDITLLFKDGGSVFLDQELWNISYAGVETIQFADGTVWNKSDLKIRSLIGGDGDDSIVGFGTDDFVDGGNGADTLTGGDGTDTFHFSFGGTGHDVITDFLAGAGSEDVLEFETGIFADLAAVVASASDDGTDTTIAISDDTSITLQNVLVSQLHQDDFQFV